jgi:hypothetical protein
MSRSLVGDDLWLEIRARAGRSRRLIAVVGYLGRHPAAVLKWPKHSTVICDLSRDVVARGTSSARGARELLSKKVGIFSLRRLHAKIYIFDTSAIVCSANLSESSAQLVEAGILVSDPECLRELLAFANRLRDKALPIHDDKFLRALGKIEPRRVGAVTHPSGGTKARRAVPFFENDSVSLVTCELDEDETRDELREKKRRATGLASEHGLSKAGVVDWLNASRKTMRALDEYHYVLFWWKPSERASKAKYGRLDGPWQSLGGIDLGKRYGDRRYCVPLVKRKCRSILLDQARMEVLAKVLGLKKIPKEPLDLWNNFNPRTNKLGEEATRRLSSFLRKFM